MSTAQVLDPPPLKTGGSGHHKHHPPKPINTSSNTSFKRKNKHDRSGRKRSKSFSGSGGLMISQKPVLPSKFLLGGNIKDPLNLNSLQDEEINRAMNAVTPKSSPVPTPPRKKGQIEVMIPKNIHDPLNLIDCTEDEDCEQLLSSPIKKSKKKRLKKRRTMSGTMDATAVEPFDLRALTEAKTPEPSTDSAKIPDDAPLPTPDSSPRPQSSLDEVTPPKRKAAAKPKAVQELASEAGGSKRKADEHGHVAKKFKNSGMDKIVSPVVPQPGAWLKRSSSVSNKRAKPRVNKPDEGAKAPLFKEKDKRFQYGNYNRYYGYRNPNNEIDHRLRVFSHHPYLFDNKDILDIGCNIGHITHSVARDFRAKSVLGIDIDPKLIAIARKNIRHYVKTDESPRSRCGEVETDTGNGFPNNVVFKHCNYILDDDNLIALEQPQFDVILCLSISKWIHLNWGDAGMKQAFRRMYAQLRPGGKLILEPQHWASYKTKKKLTATIYQNYSTIEFFPEKFREYLLSPAVGFAKGEILGYPPHQAKGFRRPIQVFTKSTMFPSERVEATPLNFTPSVASLDSFPNKMEKYESQSSVSHVYTNISNIFADRFCGVAEENADANDKIKEELLKGEVKKPDSERTITSEEGDESRVEVDSGVSEGGDREATPEAGDNT